MTAWNPDQSESDLWAPAKTPFPSFDAVYLRFRAVPAPPTCPSAPPSSCPSALPRLSIAWLANSLQAPPQIPFRFPHIQHERSIFDNEWHAQHRFLHPPFTTRGRHRAPSCHPERSERSERSRGIPPFRCLAAAPVEMTTPPVIPSAANAAVLPLSSRAQRMQQPPCHPERSERSERSRGISLLRSSSCDGRDFSTPGPSAPPVEMTKERPSPPPVCVTGSDPVTHSARCNTSGA